MPAALPAVLLLLMALLIPPSPRGAATAAPAGSDAPPAVAAGSDTGARFIALVPARLLDTRSGVGVDEAGKVGPGEVVAVTVAGRGGVPASGAVAVALDVTATGPTADTSVTAWPTGEPRPAAAQLAVASGVPVANVVVVPVGTDGKVSFRNAAGDVHLSADVVGWWGAARGALHHALVPARVMDTRSGLGVPAGRIGERGSVLTTVTGKGEVPSAGVSSVVLTVTAYGATQDTALTVYTGGGSRPAVANVQVQAGQQTSALVIVRLRAVGTVRVYNRSGTVHATLDVVGWFGPAAAIEGAGFTPSGPTRILDTRDGTGVTAGRISQSSSKVLQVTGAGGVPASRVSAVLLDLTGLGSAVATSLLVYPEGTQRPAATSLSVGAGATVHTLVAVKIGTGGRIRIANTGTSGSVHAVGVVVGWYGSESPYGPVRLISRGQYGSAIRDLVSTVGANGDIHIAWREASELLYKKVDSDGNVLIDTVRTGWPIASVGYGSRYVQLAPQPDGGVVVMWNHIGDVMGARLDGAGRVAEEPAVVTEGSYQYLAIDADAAGTVQRILNQIRLTGDDEVSGRAMYETSSPDFTPAATPLVLSTQVNGKATRYTGVAVDANGTTHMAWFDKRNYTDNYRYDVFYARFGGPGPAIAPVVISSKVGGFPMSGDSAGVENEGPKIDIDRTGRAHVAWVIGNRVYYSSITAAGTMQAKGVEVDVDAFQTTSKYFDGDVLAMPDGTAVIVFSSGSDATSKLVRVRVDATGGVRVPALLLDLGAGVWGRPQLHLIDGEEVLIARFGPYAPARVAITNTGVAQRTDLADLVVDDAHSTQTSTPDPPKEGTTVTVTAQAANTGFVASPATTAEVRHGGSVVATLDVPALAPDATFTLQWQWTVPAAITTAVADLTIVVDPLDGIEELTEVNNQATHPVSIWLRPVGTAVTIVGFDETTDPGRVGYDPVEELTMTLTGTPSEGGGSYTETVIGGSWATILGVPPGTYDMTVSKAGYAIDPTFANPGDVTVTRNPTDPYDITATFENPLDADGSLVVWLNRWGSITGTVTGPGGGPLGGITVTDTSTGASAITQPNGSYTFTRLTPGTHLLDLTGLGYARQLGVPIEVVTGPATDGSRQMQATPIGYIDVTVTGPGGAALSQATVRLVDGAGHPVGVPCTPDARGRCSFEAQTGTALRVRSTAPNFTAWESDPITLVAGQVVAIDAAMSLELGALTMAVRHAYMTSWAIRQVAPVIVLPKIKQSYWQELYGNYHLDMQVGRQTIGGVPYVQALVVSADGDAWTFMNISTDEDDDYGVEAGGIQEVDGDIGGVWDREGTLLRTIVRLMEIRVVDLASDRTVWTTAGTDLLPVDSGPGWDESADVVVVPQVAVGSQGFRIEIDLNVYKGDPADGSGPLGGYRSNTQTILWYPAGGTVDAVYRPA